MTKLLIKTDLTGMVPVVSIKGRVDSDSAPQLDSALADVLGEGKNKIVLDLREVDYMSSAGLRSIVKNAQAAQKSGGELRLASVSDAVEVVLRTVGMLQMFKLYTTSGEAASF